MIYIDKDKSTVFGLTLTEKATITGAHFLFKFTSDFEEDAEPVYYAGEDISAYPERLNIFEIIEGTEITLTRGQYTYEVYESQEPTDDVTETTGKVIESGRMVVALKEDEADKGQNTNAENPYD